MTDHQRDQKILEICTLLADIKSKVYQDYNAIYGNGKPGLIKDMEGITTRVAVLEEKEKSHQNRHGALAAVIAFLVNAAIALYAIIKSEGH